MVIKPASKNVNPNPAARLVELERLGQLHESLKVEVCLRTAELLKMRHKTEKAKRAALARKAKQKRREEGKKRDDAGDVGPTGGGLGSVV
jgi:hypothetical protein